MTEKTAESYLRENLDIYIDSILDVGTGYGGVFDYGRWESQHLTFKVCLDIYAIKPDIAEGWYYVKASATNLPFQNKSFDLLQSTEMIEHIKGNLHHQVLTEFRRVAEKAVFLTTSDITKHKGQEQRDIEKRNPFQKYRSIIKREVLEDYGFKILLDDGHTIKAIWRNW